jgi:hypothetical protein
VEAALGFADAVRVYARVIAEEELCCVHIFPHPARLWRATLSRERARERT